MVKLQSSGDPSGDGGFFFLYIPGNITHIESELHSAETPSSEQLINTVASARGGGRQLQASEWAPVFISS